MKVRPFINACRAPKLILIAVGLVFVVGLAENQLTAATETVNQVHTWRTGPDFTPKGLAWWMRISQLAVGSETVVPSGGGNNGALVPADYSETVTTQLIVRNAQLEFIWRDDLGTVWHRCNPAFASATGVSECWFPDTACGAKVKADPLAIEADGLSESQARLTVSTSTIGDCFPNGVAWEIIGNDLGCKVDKSGLIRAGYSKGFITVRAKDADLTKMSRFADGQLELKECGTCKGEPCIPISKSDDNSVDVRIALGGAAYGLSAGYLQIKEEGQPTSDLATQAKLQFIRGANPVGPDGSYNSGVEEITFSGDRQYKVPSCLAWVHTINAFSYTVKLYKNSDLSRSGNVGQFSVGNAEAFDTWTISNPDVGAPYTKLTVTESRTGLGHNIVASYEWTADGWNLTTDNGDRKERRVVTASDSVHVNTYTIRDHDEVLKYQIVRTYKDFPWITLPEAANVTRLTNEVIGTGPTALTNQWIFYELSTEGVNYGHLKMTIAPSGRWETYKYDASGRPIRIVSQFKNNAIPTSESGENPNRVTTITYTDSAGKEERLTKLAGVLVSHTFTMTNVENAGQDELVREIVCTESADDILPDDPDNLVKKTWTYSPGTAFEHRLHTVKNYDGTFENYSYAFSGGRLTTTIDRGVGNGSGTVTAGERTIRVTDAAGNLISEQIADFQDATKVLYSRVGSSFDDYGRPKTFTFLDTSTETISFNCCGGGTTTDRAGVMTSTEYDDLRRVKSTTKAGVTTSYEYDAASRLTKTTRAGTGSSIVLENRHYDDAGRLIDSDDPLRQVTSYSDRVENGYYVKTNKYPNTSNGSTRIESYHQDGSLYRVYGTAVNELKYDYGADDDGEFTKEIKVRGTSESEWVKTYKDRAGRVYMTTYPQNAQSLTPKSVSVFNNLGQLVKTIDPDNVVQLFSYDSRGRLFRSAVDANGDGVIDTDAAGALDRVSEYSYEVTTRDNGTRLVRRKTTRVWENVGGTPTLFTVPLEVLETAADERDTWVSNSLQVTQTHIAYIPGDHKLEQTETFPDGSKRISVYTYGRLDSVTRYNNVGTADANRIGKTSYTYDGDPYYRLKTTFDQRNGTTTYTYNDDDRISTVTTPQPNVSTAAQVTSYQYNDVNSSGRIEITTLPDLTKTTNEFYLTGELKRSSGSRTYPVEYSYEQGRISTMKTWAAGAFSGSGYATTKVELQPRPWFSHLQDLQ